MTGVIPPLASSNTVDEFTAKKNNVVTVATSNITLEGEQVINGVSCVENDRILLTGQTDDSENGIWLVGSGVYGAWSRPTDFNTGDEAAGSWTYITQGTNYSGTVWMCYTDRSCTIDTDNQNWRNVIEDPIEGFDISGLTETSTNSESDFIAKYDSSMKKVRRNDFLRPGVNTLTDGATVTINLSNPERVYAVTLGGNRTLAVTNANAGDRFIVKLIQDGTGSRTVTWFSTINWEGGSAPTLTTTADKADYFEFICTGTNTYDCINQTLNLGTSSGGSVALGDSISYYWKMDETSGTRYDSVGSLDLSSGTLPGYATGKISNAADLQSANSEYFTFQTAGTDFIFGNADFSLAFWFNIDSVASDVYIFTGPDINLRLDSASGNLVYTMSTGNVTSTATISATTWYHVALVYDSVNDLLKISVNGSAFDTSSQTDGYNGTGGFFYIGVKNSTFYDYSIDEFGVWTKALSSAEVSALYNSGSGTTYPFT